LSSPEIKTFGIYNTLIAKRCIGFPYCESRSQAVNRLLSNGSFNQASGRVYHFTKAGFSVKTENALKNSHDMAIFQG
jgi:hypothetical protein